MKMEIRRLEREIMMLDDEMQKLHEKLLQIITVRRKKEHDLKILKSNFSEDVDDRDIQTTLARLSKEGIKH